MSKHLTRHLVVSQMAAFINLIAEGRKDKKTWAVVHLKAVGRDSGAGGLAELRQLLDHALQKVDAWVMSSPPTRELLVLVDNGQQNIQQVIDLLVREHCEPSSVRALVVPLTEKGLQQVQPVILQMIPETDRASRLGLTRLTRMANVFLVLDDDPMQLKQMEHMLKAFGHVETCSVASEFLERYLKYAPNVAFVDIHLRAENGTAIAGALIEKLDPYAYVVMVSADAVKDNILSAKFKGARGFLGKPVSRDQLFRVVLGSPTFVPRQG